MIERNGSLLAAKHKFRGMSASEKAGRKVAEPRKAGEFVTELCWAEKRKLQLETE